MPQDFFWQLSKKTDLKAQRQKPASKINTLALSKNQRPRNSGVTKTAFYHLKMF